MPAYNEGENIRRVVEQWYPVLDGKADNSRLVIADSGSIDDTHSILLELKSKYPKLEILSETEKQHGPKVIALYKYAIANNVDYVFQTDSDGQTNPDEFDKFWNSRDKYDIMLGNRTQRGDGKSRAFVEKVVCMLVRFFFGVSLPDANAPFRLMKVSVLSKYIDILPDDYNIPNIILSSLFVRNKEKHVFYEISFKPRQGGVNSINLVKITKIGWKALSDFAYFKREIKARGL